MTNPETATTLTDHALERLTADEIAAGGLLALTHVHRYELARRMAPAGRVLDLCCGAGYGSAILAAGGHTVVGVDVAPEAVAEATERFGDRASFAVGDALAYLDELDPADVDLIVCFEGIEHVPDAGALAGALARHVRHGVRVVISLPNSAGFEEENEFHTVDFGYDEATALFGRVGEHVLLAQRLAEGSVIVDAEDHEAEQRGAVTVVPHDTSAAWANHWLAVYGVDRETIGDAEVELRATAIPNHYRYMRALEQANRELLRTNRRLGHEHLGKHDAAAGITIGRLERRAADAEAEVERLEERLELEIEVAKHNDAMFQEARRLLGVAENELKRPRYRAADRAARVVEAVPGLKWLLRKLLRR